MVAHIMLIHDTKQKLMKMSLQVVLVANSLPALNDVTAMEVPDIVAEAAKVCLLLGKKL